MKQAFTMAEILLSLTIIGVVAAITLPSLTGNINERTWNTQRKALYARMSQAIALMPALNGFGEISGEGTSSEIDTATETFIANGLSKVLKINNICADKFEDCGIPEKFMPMGTDATATSFPKTLYNLNNKFELANYTNWEAETPVVIASYKTKDTKAVAFETQNGESIIAYYNQTCKTEYLNEEATTSYDNVFGFPEATMCVNFIYDLNGTKGPNTVGKDIGFITVFNSMDSTVVAPMPSSHTTAGGNVQYTWAESLNVCTNIDSDSRIPNINELSAMYINKKLINWLSLTENCWSGTIYNSQKAWAFSACYGIRHSLNRNGDRRFIRCIKR